MKTICCRLILLTLLICGKFAVAQQPDHDPFQPYLKKKPPQIIHDLGTQTLTGGIKLHKLVFYSRSIMTDSGKRDIHVFVAIAHPAGNGPFPGVLRLHGGGGRADTSVAISMAKEGYVGLVLDIPGVADEVKHHPESTWPRQVKGMANPDVTYSGLFTAVAASAQAFYLLRSQPDVDTKKLGIAGGSWGGYVATMLATLLNDDIAATWSVFGTGNFMAGSNEKQNLVKLPPAEMAAWVKYLDPGTRIANVTKPYYIISASNDKHWSFMAVQATLTGIKAPTSVFYAPNEDHRITYPGGWKMMEYFNYYMKHQGPPLPQIKTVQSALDQAGNLTVKLQPVNATGTDSVKVFYSNPDVKTTAREWKKVIATANADGTYSATIPDAAFAAGVDWYAIITDKNPAWNDQFYSSSTWIQHLSKP